MLRKPARLLLWLLAFSSMLLPAAVAQTNIETQAEHFAEAGQQALAAGQMGEARANFEQLVKLNPRIAEAHATLAAIYFQQREYQLAAQEVRTAQKLKPSLPKLDSLLGLSLAEMDRFADGLPLLEKGFKQTTDAQLRRMCGLQLLRAYTGLNKDPDAVQTALALNKAYPDDPEVLYHTGRIYGNFAYVTMEKLHDKAPDSVWMLQAQGDANESAKSYDAAIVAYQHVLVLDPQRPGIHYRLGRVYLSRYRDTTKNEDREAAKREFNAELAVDPGNGNASYELAQMAAADNDLHAARQRYEDLVALFPDFEQALVGLGGIYIQDQAGAKAVELLERATKLDAEDEVAWYRLAQAERAAGNRDGLQKAMQSFRKLHDASSAPRKPRSADDVTPQQIGENPAP